METLTRDKLRILLVDDEENDVVLLKHTLRQAGYTYPITHLKNGGVTLEYFRFKNASATPAPHVVLLDIHMPRLGGIEFLRILREHALFHGLPVIMLSATDDESDIRESGRLGIFKFLHKEPHYDKVVQALDSLLASINKQPESQRT